MILVVGSVVAKPGQLLELLRLSQEHVARSRSEAGCISHAVHQDTENSQRLVFFEEWRDMSALQEHFKVAGTRQFAKAIGALAASPPTLSVFEANQVQVAPKGAT